MTRAAAAPSLVCEEFAGGDRAAHPEDRLERSELFEAGVETDPFVTGEHGFTGVDTAIAGRGDLDAERYDLFFELAALLGGGGLAMAAEREFVLGFTRDTVLADDFLGCEAHVDVELRHVFHHPGVGGQLVSRRRE